MGRGMWGEGFCEGRLTDFLERLLAEWGIATERHNVHPERDNLLALLPASDPHDTRLWLWEVHQDTVPTDGMTIDPFAAEIVNQRVYGRGACDVKGAMACLLAAVGELQTRPHPHLVLAFTVNEEFGFSGAKRLVETWQSGRSRILHRAPDLAVVSEPTDLHVVTTHKGAVRWRIHAKGRAAHSSTPQLGQNAIYRMAPILGRLEYYASHVLSQSPSHPQLGLPSLSVGLIQGGTSVNVVPDNCWIDIDRRLSPDESAQEARQHVIDFLDQSLPGMAEHAEPFLQARGLSDGVNLPLADELISHVQQLGWPSARIAVPFGTNAAEIGAHGFPTVVFGPGDIRQAHTADEWISIESLQRAVAVLVQWASAKPTSGT
ncbi:MAG: M20 family metallopeptidase [Planctomycetota bacterium]|nr:M20 family metallopeptidase [Planctomycetota bacterium]